MSNFYTAEQVAGLAAALISADLALVPTVSRSFEGDFGPGTGTTVHVRVPAAAVSVDRSIDDVTTELVFTQLAETSVPIALSTHAISAVVLSEGDTSLRLEDFGAQVLQPQCDAVADRVDAAVAAVLNGVTPTTGLTFDPDNPEKAFTFLRRELRNRGVNLSGPEPLYAIAGGNVVDALLDSDALSYAKTGDADALRSGSVGRVRGFQVLESSRIDDDAIVAYPRSAVHLAVRPPRVPEGAKFSSVVQAENRTISLRYLRDYDPTTTADRSVVSTFVGATAMPAFKVTRTGATATRTEIPGGHIVRVATA